MEKATTSLFLRRRIEAIYTRVYKEQLDCFKVGDIVRIVRRVSIRYKDGVTTELNRQEDRLRAFLYSGHTGLVVKVSQKDCTGLVKHYSVQKSMTPEDIEDNIRSIGTVEIHLKLNEDSGTIIQGKDITLVVDLTDIVLVS